MLSKTITSFSLFVILLLQGTYSAERNVASLQQGGTRSSRTRVARGERRLKAPKNGGKTPKATDAPNGTKAPKTAKSSNAPKSTKGTKATNAPKSTKATKATKAPDTMAPTMVPDDEGQPDPIDTLAPTLAPTNATLASTNITLDDDDVSNTTDTNSTNTNTTNDITMPSNCTMDSDCGDDSWYCMEKSNTCCEYNTTCRIETDNTMATSGASMFVYGIVTTVAYGAILSVVMW